MGIGAVIYRELSIVMINYFNKKAARRRSEIDRYVHQDICSEREESTDWILDVWASGPCGKESSLERVDHWPYLAHVIAEKKADRPAAGGGRDVPSDFLLSPSAQHSPSPSGWELGQICKSGFVMSLGGIVGLDVAFNVFLW